MVPDGDQSYTWMRKPCLASGMASWKRWHLSAFMTTELGFQTGRGWKFTLCMTENPFLAGTQGLPWGWRVGGLDKNQKGLKSQRRILSRGMTGPMRFKMIPLSTVRIEGERPRRR